MTLQCEHKGVWQALQNNSNSFWCLKHRRWGDWVRSAILSCFCVVLSECAFLSHSAQKLKLQFKHFTSASFFSHSPHFTFSVVQTMKIILNNHCPPSRDSSTPSTPSNFSLFWLIVIVVSALCSLHLNDTSRCALNHSIPVHARSANKQKEKQIRKEQINLKQWHNQMTHQFVVLFPVGFDVVFHF